MNSIGIKSVACEYLCGLFSSRSCVWQTGDASLHLFARKWLYEFNTSESPEDLVWFEIHIPGSSPEGRSPGDSAVINWYDEGALRVCPYLRTSASDSKTYPDLGAIVQFTEGTAESERW